MDSMNGLLFPITLTLQAALTSLVLFAVIGVPLALYTARSKTRVSRAVLFLATLPLISRPSPWAICFSFFSESTVPWGRSSMRSSAPVSSFRRRR